MDPGLLRAWRFSRQGLPSMLDGRSPEDVLEATGWARSVGGANPYITLFARAGTSREDADAAARDARIHELPSARGCTYVLPAEDFALGLCVGRGAVEAPMATARKYLGVTDAEIDALCGKVLDVLSAGPLDPAGMKAPLGNAARNLGEEGKKRGQTTTLPLALGRLQAYGKIRRIPVNGRLDQQRYAYTLWLDSPASRFDLSDEQAFIELAKRYFRWVGPASIGNFQFFSGLGVKAAKAATDPLGLQPVEPGSDLLLLPEDVDAFHGFRAPAEPRYALLSSLDGLFAHRRDVRSFLEDGDAGRKMQGDKSLYEVGGLQDLSSNAIVDHGRIIGLWEYDPFVDGIAWQCWIEPDEALKREVARTEAFIRDQLGDARTFSLDSPESRKPKIAALRA